MTRYDPGGVNLHCALCDDVLFTAPLELAAGLLDFLQENATTADAAMPMPCEPAAGQAGYAISARIQSAVCIGAAMSSAARTAMDSMPEVVYNKLQQVLDFRVSVSSPLRELERATLLHSKFLLELCFGCGRSLSMPSRLAVRLFRAMQISDGLTIWNILEDRASLVIPFRLRPP